MADLPIISNDAQPTLIVDASVNSQIATVNADGTLNSSIYSTHKATYAAGIHATVPAATATDILTISGSATKTVKVYRIWISGSQTGNGITPIEIIKRSTLDTGGTSTTLTNVSLDSTDAASTAVVKVYTANPTALGTSVGAILQDQVTFNNGLASGLEDKPVIEFGHFGKPVILRSATENIALNFGSTSVTAGSVNLAVVWTEE